MDFQVAPVIKNLPAEGGDLRVQSPGWEVPLEKEKATRSSIPAWKIPWTEEPTEVQSVVLRRAGHD